MAAIARRLPKHLSRESTLSMGAWFTERDNSFLLRVFDHFDGKLLQVKLQGK